ncbi:DUF4185 domain-containing protein [Melittangium boletus]|uniref:DUF4185 domain-containing protein n=1 Tax=Melittangium boletus DSM 14713 TaxID=1294270 RepID=A0A250INB8_9BACT|nr:DUF4185 domain-containing protein [Melittangium boletus]ATB32768.1 hypothetical protein MEBOL_006257 [Melittangium boletus DSM 14713]
MKTKKGWGRGGLAAAGWLLVLPPGMAGAVVPPDSTFFSTVHIESADSLNTVSDGDLWPSCWADDGHLYSANGDGRGFTMVEPRPDPVYDIAVSRIQGMPGGLTGTTLTTRISQTWKAGRYNRKPTGMVCVDGALYMAVQDLEWDFNDAPNATIAKSTDHGATWTWNTSAPMFGDYVFTTIMFLDYGKNNAWNTFDNYVYAYGLDFNWRDSFDNSVSDPTKLYLARVPKTSILNRATWEFYKGDLNGNASWTPDIAQRKPVLQDDRRIYASIRDPDVNRPRNTTVLSQGGVVYNKALNRYLYTSWTEYTFEFYEAPNPWGPWKKFMTKDYGGYPWSDTKNGGYATTIPSKFISADGKTMYVQSNTFMGSATNYNFSLRKLVLEPRVATTPSNGKSDAANLAIAANGTRPIEKSAHFGNTAFLNNGFLNDNEDSWDQENKTVDWWGYTWPRNYNLNKVSYTTGHMFSDGGWFSGNLRAQVRQNGQWVDVSNPQITPSYPFTSAAGTNKTYTFMFDDTWGDGVRIIGTPGGSAAFTSIGELAVHYATGVLQDSGFEKQTGTAVSAPWYVQGPDNKGIDRGLGLAHGGANNGWIHTASRDWNALKQDVQVTPNTNYVLTGWLRGSNNVVGGFFGVCTLPGVVISEVNYGSLPHYTLKSVAFNSGSNTTVSVYAGYWSPGADSFIQVDDLALSRQ